MGSAVHQYDGEESLREYKEHLEWAYGDIFEITYEETGAGEYQYKTVNIRFDNVGEEDLRSAGVPEPPERVDITITDRTDHPDYGQDETPDSGFSLSDLVPSFLRIRHGDLPNRHPYGVSGELVTHEGEAVEPPGPVFEETTLEKADDALKSLFIEHRIYVKPKRDPQTGGTEEQS